MSDDTAAPNSGDSSDELQFCVPISEEHRKDITRIVSTTLLTFPKQYKLATELAELILYPYNDADVTEKLIDLASTVYSKPDPYSWVDIVSRKVEHIVSTSTTLQRLDYRQFEYMIIEMRLEVVLEALDRSAQLSPYTAREDELRSEL